MANNDRPIQVRLLGTGTRPAAGAEWLAAAGQARMSLQAADSYEHFYLLIQTAACGLGIGDAPRCLVADELARGQLVAPFGFVTGPHKLNLWVAPHLRARPEVQRLAAWLEAEMQAA